MDGHFFWNTEDWTPNQFRNSIQSPPDQAPSWRILDEAIAEFETRKGLDQEALLIEQGPGLVEAWNQFVQHSAQYQEWLVVFGE